MNPIFVWLFTFMQAAGIPVTDAPCWLQNEFSENAVCEAPAPPPPEDVPFEWTTRQISNGF